MAEVTRNLDHPAAFAEVEHYSRHHQRRAKLEVARRAITADIDKEDDTLQGIEHHMEAYGLHERLAEARRRINQLNGTVHTREAEICRIRRSNDNPEMPPDFERNGG